MSVKQHVMRCTNRMLARAWTALLCDMVLRLFTCLFLQQDISGGSSHFGRSCINCKGMICFL